MTNFISGAIKHPGAATAAAKAEGLSVQAWAAKHQHDKGVIGDRARLAMTLAGISRKNTGKSSLAKAAAGR